MGPNLLKQFPKDSKRVYFPWEDVFASMSEKPERVKETAQPCKSCGGKVLSIYFSSPSWTWEKLCGKAGTMLICPSCVEQLDFCLEIMN